MLHRQIKGKMGFQIDKNIWVSDRQTDRPINWVSDRQTNGVSNRRTKIQMGFQTDRQTDKWGFRQTDRQTNGVSNLQTGKMFLASSLYCVYKISPIHSSAF